MRQQSKSRPSCRYIGINIIVLQPGELIPCQDKRPLIEAHCPIKITPHFLSGLETGRKNLIGNKWRQLRQRLGPEMINKTETWSRELR